MKKNFLCVLVAILLFINLQISVSAYNKSTVPKEFYDTSIENYPNINNYLNIVFSEDAENINIFDASDKNITEEFVLNNANKGRQEYSHRKQIHLLPLVGPYLHCLTQILQ